MKIVFAPDKFKMCMKSATVCRVMQQAFRTVFPDAELVSVPVSDGGEGMTRALADALHGEMHKVRVTGPDGNPVEAEFALINNGLTAVFEMSSASGLYLVNPLKRDPMTATTYGTGEVIRMILDLGVRDILIGTVPKSADSNSSVTLRDTERMSCLRRLLTMPYVWIRQNLNHCASVLGIRGSLRWYRSCFPMIFRMASIAAISHRSCSWSFGSWHRELAISCGHFP